MAGYKNFIPQSSGVVDGVSFILLAQDGSELHFKGHLDYKGDLVNCDRGIYWWSWGKCS